MTSLTLTVLALLLLGGITYLYRFSFISPHGRHLAEKFPANFLKLLAPATFAAIISNHLFGHFIEPEELRRRAIVAGLALIVAYYSRNVVITLVFGLLLLYAFQQLGI